MIALVIRLWKQPTSRVQLHIMQWTEPGTTEFAGFCSLAAPGCGSRPCTLSNRTHRYVGIGACFATVGSAGHG